MKCEKCGRGFEFPIYEEEVRVQKQPFFGPNCTSTTPTGKTIPVCPFCGESIYGSNPPLSGEVVVGPKGWAEREFFKGWITK